eukprot:41334_1
MAVNDEKYDVELGDMKSQSNNIEEEKINENSEQRVGVHININDDHFQVEHFISNPLVIILGVESYEDSQPKWDPLPGVQKDVQAMTDLFYNRLKFDTEVLTNYVKNNVNDTTFSKDNVLAFLKMCTDKIQWQYNGLICIVSGHGVADYFICGDGKTIEIKKILFARFCAEFVPGLSKYPKVFIIDACRGTDWPVEVEKEIKKKLTQITRGPPKNLNELISLNVESGYRISYATTKDKRIPESPSGSGGKFIQAFYKTMLHLFEQKILHEINLQTILRMSSQKAVVKRAVICPVHEDYTIYKIFIRCKYSDDLTIDNEYRIKSELYKLFKKRNAKHEDRRLEIMKELIVEHDDDKKNEMEQIKLQTMSSISYINYDKYRKKPTKLELMESKKHKLKQWLDEVDLGKYFKTFIDNGYPNLEYIQTINTETHEELKTIGIDLIGHRGMLLKHIDKLKIKQQEKLAAMDLKKSKLRKFLERNDMKLSEKEVDEHVDNLFLNGFESVGNLRNTKVQDLERVISKEVDRNRLVECVNKIAKLRRFLERNDMRLSQKEVDEYFDNLIWNGFESVDDLRNKTAEDLERVISNQVHRERLVEYVKREYQCWRKWSKCSTSGTENQYDHENDSCWQSCCVL